MYSCSQQFIGGFFTTLGALTAISLMFPFYHAANVACSRIIQKQRKCSYRQDCKCGCENVVAPGVQN